MMCIALCVVSCKKDIDDPSIQRTAVDNVVATNLNNDLLLKLVNDKRTSGCTCGETVMPPVAVVTWNNQLAAAALEHSKDMNTNNYFEHVSLNGKRPGDRIVAAGYKWLAYGENIALGHTTEQAVFDAWINSEGHCKNIMGSFFKEMGAARDGKYWTQDFGAK